MTAIPPGVAADEAPAVPENVGGILASAARRPSLRGLLGLGWAAGTIGILAAEGDALLAVLTGLGFSAAFLSGLVGVGGAIVLIPLLLLVPPFVGVGSIEIATVTGISIVQVTAATVAAVWGHRGSGYIDRDLVVTLGLTMTIASFIGAAASSAFPGFVLEAVFASLAAFAAVLMLVRRAPEVRATTPDAVTFDRGRAVVVGLAVGLLAGFVGAGGAFLLVPLSLHVLGLPMRTVVASTLLIVAVSSGAGMVGKALTGQVDWILAGALVLGALPGGRIGAYVSQRTHPARLRLVLGVVILIVAIRMWVDIVL